ncbi:MAG: DUF1080 domain-containing protein [Gemmatimonadales bacterium]
MFRRALTSVVASALPAALIIACGGNSQRAALPPEPTGPNTITEAERRDGWKLLFDGNSTTGWHSYKQATAVGWAAQNGELYHTTGGADLVSDQQYDSFELQLDWKVATGGNSGIFWWANEGTGEIYENAPEMQILDNIGHPDGKSPMTAAGSLYGLYPTQIALAKPVGEWNHARLVVKGSKVEQWFNGVRVVVADFDSKEMKDKIASTKFKAWPTFGKSRRGHIGLQFHGTPIWFRNVVIKEFGR